MKVTALVVLGSIALAAIGLSNTTKKTTVTNEVTNVQASVVPLSQNNNNAQSAGTGLQAQSQGADLSVTSLKLTSKNVIKLYEDVSPESAERVVNEIKAHAGSKEPIYLLLNSPGGSVMDGALVVSAMEASSAPVYTVCMQLCASMAAIIHQYGKERYMVNRSLLMFHPAAGGLQGSLDQMRSRLGMIDRYVNKMDAYIAKRAGIPYERFMVAILTEVWIDAEDSLALHFNDKIVNVVEDQSEKKILPVLPSARAYKTFLDIKG